MEDLRQCRNRQTYHRAFWILLAKKAYDKIKVSDFADVTGMNRKTFYAYYTDVDALARSCIRELLELIYDVNVQDYTNWDVTYRTFEHIIRYQKQIRLIEEKKLESLVHEELRARMCMLADEVMPDELHFDQELLHDYSVAISWRCMVWGMHHADRTPEELTRDCLDTYRSYIIFMASQYKSGGIR